MSSGSLPQLVEGQPARLDIGESLPCRVIGFSGPGRRARARGAARDDELEPEAEAYLLIEAEGRIQALRGRIGEPAGEEMVLRLIDDIRLGQRRIFSRAPISLPAVVSSRDGGEWTTVTRDVSAGGVCVARAGADPGDGALEVRIQVADHEVVAEATAVRVTTDDLGLRFEADRARRPPAARLARARLSPPPLAISRRIAGALGSSQVAL